MIIRLTAKLAQKIKAGPLRTEPLHDNRRADWSAHLFTAARTQYLMVCNTASLYTMVMYGAGVTEPNRFITRSVESLGELMELDGFDAIREERFYSEAGRVVFARSLNRSVTGSMNELIQTAEGFLVDHEMSPWDVSIRLNGMLFSCIDYHTPREAFAARCGTQ